jgi:hypothetical protein
MIIQPRHFVRFIDGRAGQQIAIAFLPGGLGVHIGTLQTAVSLEINYAKKLLRHGLTYEGFDQIQDTIDNGLCIREGSNRLSFLYIKDDVKPELYFLHLKTARMGSELWLVTFHRIRQRQFNKRLAFGPTIREHIEKEFMG